MSFKSKGPMQELNVGVQIQIIPNVKILPTMLQRPVSAAAKFREVICWVLLQNFFKRVAFPLFILVRTDTEIEQHCSDPYSLKFQSLAVEICHQKKPSRQKQAKYKVRRSQKLSSPELY